MRAMKAHLHGERRTPVLGVLGYGPLYAYISGQNDVMMFVWW